MRKFGAVDDHQYVGPQVDDSLGRIANALKDGWQLSENPAEPDDRKIVDREQTRKSLDRNVVAADTDEPHCATSRLLERPHQGSAKTITRLLACHEHNCESAR